MLSLQHLALSLSSFTLLNTFLVLSILILTYTITYTIYTLYFHPFSTIPGPFLARLTNLWYFHGIRFSIGPRTQTELHTTYGPVVRTAPNDLSIALPSAIDQIYGPRAKFTKTEFYDTFASRISRRKDTFTERDEALHGPRRKAVASLYTQASVLEYEDRIDGLIDIFSSRLAPHTQSGEPIDIADLLRKYTFDVIGELFYGKDGGFGFMRDNTDYNGWLCTLDTMVPTVSSISYLPSALRTLYLMSGLVHAQTRAAMSGFFKVIADSHQAVAEKLADLAQTKPSGRKDLLTKLIEISQTRGQELDFSMLDVTTEIWGVIWAGSDTTAIALGAIFWFLHSNPWCLERLTGEIEEAFKQGRLSEPVRYLDAIKLRYLHAVVLESMRLHPSLGTMLPRYPPREGASVAGVWVPGWCRVGINAVVMQRDKVLFGDDADHFVPERWIRDGEKRAAVMERHLLQFGYGARVCIGKQITMTEMYKLLPTVFRRYKFEVVGPESEVVRGWFQHRKNLWVKVSRRC